tara:strand:- start:2409 stop:3536 length:1128 start_codon:yes stop_codon:yes gene_type:complete
MSFYKFDKKEVLLNKVRANPENKLHISGSDIYLNNSSVSGIKPIRHVSGSTLMVVRNSYNARPLFEATASYNSTESLPSTLYTKNYFLSSSVNVASDYLVGATPVYPVESPPNPKLSALKNTLNNYTKNSIHYAFTASVGDYNWNKPEQDLMLVSIPSSLYGSQIQPGTVDLRFYITGTLAAQLTDSNETGELIQTSAGTATTGEGSVAGVVLYNEGFLLLTGSWDIGTENLDTTSAPPKWRNFATQSATEPATSFDIGFNGTTYTPVMTMFAHANRGELNSSNNPTFLVHSSSADGNPKLSLTGAYQYIENPTRAVKNVASSSFAETGSFEKTTYLSSIGIYDEDRNLIGIAKLANPIRKREKDSYTFKLKMDL